MMKRTTGLLIALIMVGSVHAATTESVVPQEVGFVPGDELVLDDVTLTKMDHLDKEMSFADKAYLAAVWAEIQALEFKDKAVAHIRAHKRAYIAGSVTLAAVIIWYLLRKSGGSDTQSGRNFSSAHPDMPQSSIK
jgi:hypothetical protein